MLYEVITIQSMFRRCARIVLVLTMSGWLLLLGAFLLRPEDAWASTFQVSNTNDSGVGSLRQAILDANNNPGPDKITFAAALLGQTIA